jgi:Leucine-rich repeat (LRR) protein
MKTLKKHKKKLNKSNQSNKSNKIKQFIRLKKGGDVDYTVRELNLSFKYLTELPDLSLYTNLKKLDCSYNKLTSLPNNLPKSLQILYFYSNQITSLDNLPPNLKELDCSGNQITSLNNLPASIEGLDCSNNQITSLDNLPVSLKKLICLNNQITSLDNLPASLQQLDCLNNQITSLDKLPASLELFNCENNQIKSLNNFPATLEKLDCSNNQITSLDNLPVNLKELECSNNKITSLDNLPTNIKGLFCSHNKITSLDNLPASLQTLECDNNPLIYDFEPTIKNIRNYNNNKVILDVPDEKKIYLTKKLTQNNLSVQEYLLQNLENIVLKIEENETFLYYPTSKTEIQNALATSPDQTQSNIQLGNVIIQKNLAEYFMHPFASQYAFIKKSETDTDNLLEPTTLYFEPKETLKEPTKEPTNKIFEQTTTEPKLSVNVLIKGIKTAVEIEETTLPSQLKQKIIDQGLVQQTDLSKIRLIFGGKIIEDTKVERNPLTLTNAMETKPNYIVNLNGFVSGETTINVM